MWPDRVSNPGPLTYESGALPAVLRGPAKVPRNKRYDVDVKIYLHDVNYIIYRNGTTCMNPKTIS